MSEKPSGPPPEPRGQPGRDELGALVGITDYERGEDWARATLEVTDRVRQPYGIVHGGAYSVLAETLCSRATAEAVAPLGMGAMGQANNASFLRPISEGHVYAEAKAYHRGRTSWVWDVQMTNDEGTLCALVRMTVAVRPISPGSGS
ncbi:MAG: PaaI family thioesterase [Solirubrobacterales bacterium]